MSSLILWADYAITAGGSTCWELCCLGTPFAVESLTDNQSALVRHLQQHGIASALFSLMSVFSGNGEELFAEQSKRERALVSGDGADAVIQVCRERPVRLRNVRFDDRDFLFTMVNNPEIRKFSGTAGSITPEEHSTWFRARLHSSDSHIFIVYTACSSQPDGYIRFEASEGKAVLSVALDPRQHDQGFGYFVIVEGCKELARASCGAVQRVIANVRQDNPRALRVFGKAGFRRTGEVISKDNITLVEMSLQNINNLL
jgi:RimJ/RimL family protein N-acetyltransferase